MSTGELTAAATPETTTTPAAPAQTGHGDKQVRGERQVAKPDLSKFDPEVAAYIAAHPTLLDSVSFRAEYRAAPDADRKWLLEYAKERLKEAKEIYGAHDAKAASVVTHLGSGTGLLTLGAVAAVGNGTIPTLVAWSALAPFFAATYALCLALRARQSHLNITLPAARRQARYADDSPAAEAETVADYDLAAEFLIQRAVARANDLNASLRWMVASVVLLIVPLVAVIVAK